MVAIDDIQWIDSSSWALLLRLVREVQRALIIVAARTDTGADPAPMEALIRVHGLRTIELGSLARDDVLTLICQAFRVDSLPDAVARFVAERAEGHPFFSLELAYALRDAGSLEIAGGSARVVADLEQLEFPESIEGVIAIRLDQPDPGGSIDTEGRKRARSVVLGGRGCRGAGAWACRWARSASGRPRGP